MDTITREQKALYTVAVFFAVIYFFTIFGYITDVFKGYLKRHNEYNKPAYYALEECGLDSSVLLSVDLNKNVKYVTFRFGDLTSCISIARYFSEYMALNSDCPLNKNFKISLLFLNENRLDSTTCVEFQNYYDFNSFGNDFSVVLIDNLYGLDAFSCNLSDNNKDFISKFKFMNFNDSDDWFPRYDFEKILKYTNIDTIRTLFRNAYNFNCFTTFLQKQVNIYKPDIHIQFENYPKFDENENIEIETMLENSVRNGYYNKSNDNQILDDENLRCVYIKEGGKYSKYYPFISEISSTVELIRAEVIDESMCFFSGAYSDLNYSDSDVHDYLVNNIYNNFSENVKKIIMPKNLKDSLNTRYNANIYILSRDRIEECYNSTYWGYRIVLDYLKPGTWVCTQDGKSGIYQLLSIKKGDGPKFISIDSKKKGYVQPTISVDRRANIVLSDKVIPNEYVWIFKGDE